ncbi:hypothetical protein Godav_001060 [Gossypium davidsonii]|uniref:Uncharacterized protein n=1 Tax=Gossypium davidsonii TaxID=34287 RepID=A0A7J8T1Q5_GOSDV|nr:hypothetical protein [Gossypium davidsonii]
MRQFQIYWTCWTKGHFWKVEKVSYRVFSKNYSPLKQFVANLTRQHF